MAYLKKEFKFHPFNGTQELNFNVNVNRYHRFQERGLPITFLVDDTQTLLSFTPDLGTNAINLEWKIEGGETKKDTIAIEEEEKKNFCNEFDLMFTVEGTAVSMRIGNKLRAIVDTTLFSGANFIRFHPDYNIKSTNFDGIQRRIPIDDRKKGNESDSEKED